MTLVSGRFVAALLKLNIEAIASWVGFKLDTALEDAMLSFWTGTLNAISPILSTRQHAWLPDVEDQVKAFEKEAMGAGFSRFDPCFCLS